VSDHTFADSPAPLEHTSVQHSGYRARKPAIAMHESECNRGDQKSKKRKVPKAHGFEV
jgi:hypothetical protein